MSGTGKEICKPFEAKLADTGAASRGIFFCMITSAKPLGIKSYGSIPHLIGSRLGLSDRHAHEGQIRIATEKLRDKHDRVYIQEKLDGGNVGIAKLNGKILAITRAGYLAETSPYKTHHAFKIWVQDNEQRFIDLLHEGERLCGEWLLTAVGTIYDLPHEPFVAFDLMIGSDRVGMTEFYDRVYNRMLAGEPINIAQVESILEPSGHGAIDPVEGAIWRVERKNKVDFLVKYVRHEKVDGKYLEETIFNGVPAEFRYLQTDIFNG